MADFFIYELDGRITIWEGAALILNIDPANVLEQPRRLADDPFYGIGEILENENSEPYLYPDKENYKYEKVMIALINEANRRESSFKAELFYNEYNPPVSLADQYVCQASTIDINALKEWALEKGFKSEFLGNLEPEIIEQPEQSGAFNKQAQRELVFKCWLKFHKVDIDQAMTKTQEQIWAELSNLDESLFNAQRKIGLEEFFKNQKYVNFPRGKNKKLEPLD